MGNITSMEKIRIGQYKVIFLKLTWSLVRVIEREREGGREGERYKTEGAAGLKGNIVIHI